MEIRKPSFAGSFYPEDKDELKNQIINFLNQAKKADFKPKALIVPHAGYIYSGQTAAYAYKLLNNQKKIILLGPCHNASHGLLSDTSDYWETPLGKTKLFHPDIRSELSPKLHKIEHSLEVQLPFLQCTLKEFEICPILIANTDLNFVSKEIESIPNDLIIVSSDLSHYHPLLEAKVQDEHSINYILKKDVVDLEEKGEACGSHAISVLLKIAKRKNWEPVLLNYSTSFNTSKDKESVVGYAAIGFK